MHFATVAAALCLCLPAATGFAAPQAQRADAPAVSAPAVSAPAVSAPAATQQAAGTATASSSGDAAAARHAKRRACLKEARTKKLMGADKTSFLKTCIAAP